MKNLFLLGALLIPTIVYSANDLERWNSEVGRTVRQAQSEKLAQTTYSEISSKNVTVSQDMKTVYPQIETSAQVAGSKTRVVAEATLVVDKEKVARDWNKKLSKFGKATNAVGAALVIGGYVLDAVDWVMDEGGKVTKKATDPVVCEPLTCSHIPEVFQRGSKYYSSGQAACDGVSKPGGATVKFDGYYCKLYGGSNEYNGNIQDSVNTVPNPYYNPSATQPQNVEV